MIKRLFIILLVITIIGCAHFHKKDHLDDDYVVSFSEPLIIRPPSYEPGNIKENIKFAIFLFEQQEYKNATSVFLKVAKEIQEPDNELKELSLKAAAISSLLANDREGFIRIMQELNMDNPYGIYEQDKVLQTLNALYRKFLRRR